MTGRRQTPPYARRTLTRPVGLKWTADAVMTLPDFKDDVRKLIVWTVDGHESMNVQGEGCLYGARESRMSPN